MKKEKGEGVIMPQLLDVVIVVSSIDSGYPISRVFRFDVEDKDLDNLLKKVEDLSLEGGQMRNE